MELVERYLYEVGRRLPPKRRADVVAELRSSIELQLEAEGEGQSGDAGPDSAKAAAILQEMGSPEKVAADYYPEGQYLIGPALYPLFRLVTAIAVTATVGAQLLAVLVAFVFASESPDLLGTFWQILFSVPVTIGIVAIIFAILQRYEVRPELDVEEFDPYKLPDIKGGQKVKRGELIFSIIFSIVFLVLLAQFAARGGFAGFGGLGIFNNPVIGQYLPWIFLSLLLGILVDIFLLWRGRWEISTRLAKIGANAFSLLLLGLMIQGHTEWLAGEGVSSFFDGLLKLPEAINLDNQLVGMIFFRLAMTIAFIVIAIETLVQLFWLVRGLLLPAAPDSGKLAGSH